MPKFSFIVPVYNVEKYVRKCIKSLLNQTFKDFEIIVVNDGSTDKSIAEIEDLDITIINQKNMGLSSARNKGVEKAKGKYLIFVDSDDYIEKNLLEEINKSLFNEPDLVRFQIQEVSENGEITKYRETPFLEKSGEEAFSLISKYHFVENAWCYAIKKTYYQQEQFKFKENTFHEDFGLIPLVIIKAKVVNSIDYIGYNYLQRLGSIMNSNNYEKDLKKTQDFYNHYLYLIKEINKTKLNKKVFKSFIANSLVIKICKLKKKDYNYYLNLLKKEKVFDNLLADTLIRKIKKIIIKINPKIYY